MARFSSERTASQESDLSPDTLIQIGPHRLRNSVWLAPMAGVTDAPFRQLAWRFGAGHVVGEMVSAKAELWHTRKSSLRRRSVVGITPVAVRETEVEVTTLVDANAVEGRDYDADEVAWLWRTTLEQDMALCEGTQAGIESSAYVPGPHSLDESAVDDFLGWALARLEHGLRSPRPKKEAATASTLVLNSAQKQRL